MEFNNENAAMIPYYVHEGEMVRMERLNKRWFVAFLVVIIMLFVTNAGWIIYESQFETVDIDQQVDTGESPAVVSGMGDAIYGYYPADNQGAGEEGWFSGK